MPVIVPNYAEPPHASPASPPPDFSSKCQSERLSGVALKAFFSIIQAYARMAEDGLLPEHAEALEAPRRATRRHCSAGQPRAGA
jgi:hypothetical protein